MMPSLFAGVSGLQNHQTEMDVIGNNIANVDTVAFKSSSVAFKEGFAQLLQGASRPPGNEGGINPIQVGLGMQIGAIDTNMTQGNLQSTGVNTDVAINGSSFFVARQGNQSFYSRSGNFQIDAQGNLVEPDNGFIVQGKMAINGVFSDAITDIQLPFGQKAAANPTSTMSLAGNLDGSQPVFDVTDPVGGSLGNGFNADTMANPANANSFTETTIAAYDSVGTKYDLKIDLYKAASNKWNWQVDPSSLTAAGVSAASISGSGSLTFNPDGSLSNTGTQTISFDSPGANTVTIAMDPGSGVNGITQFAGTSTAVLQDQNGYTAGTLENFSIDNNGVITGAFTNGVNVALAQIAMADFNNPAGLLRVGDNMYQQSGNSGGPVVGFAGAGSQSTLTSGALEMSNVDLATEFTNMIVAERGYQANAKTITTSDQMLQSLISMVQ
ncbi:MAG: flagellar hook protein FlgE [Gemmatimonadales bacterium]